MAILIRTFHSLNPTRLLYHIFVVALHTFPAEVMSAVEISDHLKLLFCVAYLTVKGLIPLVELFIKLIHPIGR